MRRLVVVLLALTLALGAIGAAAQEGFSLVGRVTATEQESQEGYFAVDQQTMIVVKPNSPLHAYLKGQVGQRVRIVVEPAGDSE